MFTLAVEAFGIDEAEWSGADGTALFCVTSTGVDLTTTVESRLTGKVETKVDGMAENMSVAYDRTPATLGLKYTGPLDLGETAPNWLLERVK